uniref:FIMBRIAE-ASSOCIATED PROTEIN FAP1 n=1 Tax=Streptococcus parasanguinis TaxID=1318 RepID=UPI0001DBB659
MRGSHHHHHHGLVPRGSGAASGNKATSKGTEEKQDSVRENLDKMISEAEVLNDMAARKLITLDAEQQLELMKSLVATQSQLEATKNLIGDPNATVADLQIAYTTLGNNTQALGNELIKLNPNGQIYAVLNNTEASRAATLRSTTTGTKTTFTISDFSNGGTQYYWAGGNANNLKNPISSISAVYDSATGKISWTVEYDPTTILKSPALKTLKTYTGIYIDTSSDSKLSTPTNVLIDGAATNPVTNFYGNGSKGIEYVSKGTTKGVTKHTITFDTAFSGRANDLADLEIKMLAATTLSDPHFYEDGSKGNYGRYNGQTAPYVIANDSGTAIGGYQVSGVNADSIPSDTT